MKKIKLLFLFLFFLNFLSAQVDSFTNIKNKWTYIFVGYGYDSTHMPARFIEGKAKYFFDGDTIIDEKKYLKLYSKTYERYPFAESNLNLKALLRSDNKNKIFYKNPKPYNSKTDSFSFSGEFLLYDFSLNKGDSIINNVMWRGTAPIQLIIKIVSKGSALYFGKVRNTFDVNYIFPNKMNHYRWIEGIGCDYDLFYPAMSPQIIFDAGGELACFVQDDSYCLLASNENLEERLLKIEVFPNPANEQLQIKYDSNSDSPQKISITDLSSRVLKTFSGSQQSQNIDVKDLPSGLYFISFQFTSGYLTKKFVVSR